MKKKILLKYDVTTNFNLLSDLEKKLIDKAFLSAKNAYAPYSKFNVGSALVLENNKIIIGNNQENASFPAGVCAERVALFSANANYPQEIIKKIAITAIAEKFELSEPVGPCGICRQVLLECEEKQGSDIEILLFDTKKIIKLAKAKDLLPFYFKEDRLKKI
jgi:cytidine deaminase